MIRVAVIAPGELDDQIAPRESARHTNGAHHRLRSGGDETNLLQSRIRRDDPFRQLHFRRAGSAERRAIAHGADYGVQHGGVRVSQNQRTPRAHEIEVLATIGIDEELSGASRDEQWVAAHRAERTHRRVDSAGNDATRALIQLGGTRLG